jgi:hypothetical protein
VTLNILKSLTDPGIEKRKLILQDKTMNGFLVDLAVKSRYMGQSHVPNILLKAGHHVEIISGPTDIPSATTSGAVLNFGGTNLYIMA